MFAAAPNGHLFQSLWGKLFAGRGTAEMLGVAPGRTDSLPSVPPKTDTPLLGGARGYRKASAVLPKLQRVFRILFSQFRMKCRLLRTHFCTSMTLTLSVRFCGCETKTGSDLPKPENNLFEIS